MLSRSDAIFARHLHGCYSLPVYEAPSTRTLSFAHWMQAIMAPGHLGVPWYGGVGSGKTFPRNEHSQFPTALVGLMCFSFSMWWSCAHEFHFLLRCCFLELAQRLANLRVPVIQCICFDRHFHAISHSALLPPSKINCPLWLSRSTYL